MYLRLLRLSVLLLLAVVAAAQEKTSTNLPSEETVNSFLQQTFGYDSTVTWKITAIKPSIAAGLAEVDVVLSNSQGQSVTTLYVTPDGKHALTGDILPFGAKPYQSAKEALLKGVNGPSRGPDKAPVTIVEFSDLQCPHCKDAQPVIDKLLTEEPNARFVFQNFLCRRITGLPRRRTMPTASGVVRRTRSGNSFRARLTLSRASLKRMRMKS
jgi:protein-disulfide isomerase